MLAPPQGAKGARIRVDAETPIDAETPLDKLARWGRMRRIPSQLTRMVFSAAFVGWELGAALVTPPCGWTAT